ncbi:hypothetical protein DFH06DRAFT_1129718 [Mycena polygramma]|nr:hypothetical protein DFH06DRAFT_1129718 [Mycena polygramma]
MSSSEQVVLKLDRRYAGFERQKSVGTGVGQKGLLQREWILKESNPRQAHPFSWTYVAMNGGRRPTDPFITWSWVGRWLRVSHIPELRPPSQGAVATASQGPQKKKKDTFCESEEVYENSQQYRDEYYIKQNPPQTLTEVLGVHNRGINPGSIEWSVIHYRWVILDAPELEGVFVSDRPVRVQPEGKMNRESLAEMVLIPILELVKRVHAD